MKQLKLLLTVLLLVGLLPAKSQEYLKCIILETSSGEKVECYLSQNPQLFYNNDVITLKTDLLTTEYRVGEVKKVYYGADKVIYKLVYMVDGGYYKTYRFESGAAITPEDPPQKEGYTFSGWSGLPSIMPNKDVTVIGSFVVNKYKLKYIVDGEEYKSFDIEYGTSITPEEAPTREGYIFSGWSDIPNTMPAYDVTVNGTFTKSAYTLTYMLDDQVYKTFEMEYGAEIKPEEDPVREGYTFTGWSNIPNTMPAENVIITGSFEVNEYKLKYIVDGEEYKSYNVKYGTSITPETAPTKEGYIFSGWSDIPNTMPAYDVTVTGTFTKGKYTLTYMLDGQVYKTFEMEYGAEIKPEDDPFREGYTFSGWSGLPSTMPTEDIIVIGSFEVNEYKLKYIVDGEEYKSYDVKYGTAITPEQAPTREGYIFSGWSEIPNTMPAYDVTVNGTFTKGKYTLIYMLDGQAYKTFEMEYGAEIKPEDDPVREGYTFSGWNGLPNTMPGKDVVVNGSFTINKYTVIYIIDNEVYHKEEIEFGAKILPPTVPAKDGCIFSWGEYPDSMPAKDVVIIGAYTTGINGVLADLTFDTASDYYIIKGLEANELVFVYNASGEMTRTFNASVKGVVTILPSQLSKGVNIIKTKNQSFKIYRK